MTLLRKVGRLEGGTPISSVSLALARRSVKPSRLLPITDADFGKSEEIGKVFVVFLIHTHHAQIQTEPQHPENRVQCAGLQRGRIGTVQFMVHRYIVC